MQHDRKVRVSIVDGIKDSGFEEFWKRPNLSHKNM